MKKQILFLLAILSLSMTNCKKDKSNEDDENTEKSVPVTVTSNDNSSPIMNLTRLINNQFNASRSKNLSTVTTVSNIEYDGKHIVKITSNSGSDVSIKEYYYADKENGILDSIVYTENGQFSSVDRYQMSNGHIQQISSYDANNTLESRITISGYNGDSPSQISMFFLTAYGDLNTSGSITYSGDDVASVSTTGTLGNYSISISDTYSYDTKNNVYVNVETMEAPYSMSHNPTSVSTEIIIGGSPFYDNTTTYTYTYDSDDMPISSTYSDSSSNGTIEYVYEKK